MSLVAGLLPFFLAPCLRLFYSVALAWAFVVLTAVGSIAAIALASRARCEFRQEGSTPPAEGVATDGLVLGIFSLVLLALAPLALLFALVHAARAWSATAACGQAGP